MFPMLDQWLLRKAAHVFFLMRSGAFAMQSEEHGRGRFGRQQDPFDDSHAFWRSGGGSGDLILNSVRMGAAISISTPSSLPSSATPPAWL